MKNLRGVAVLVLGCVKNTEACRKIQYFVQIRRYTKFISQYLTTLLSNFKHPYLNIEARCMEYNFKEPRVDCKT